MSMVGLSSNQPEKMFHKSLHRRNDSGELDVFEASKYFSGANEIYGYNAVNCAQKMGRDQDRQCSRGGRLSLDMPFRNAISAQNLVMEKPTAKEKKHKQPSSPGGRLASFLNSLFNQTSSKKKKSKSSAQSMKDEDESPGWRRKRRSSVSHFRSTNSLVDSKSMYSSSSSGFRTPPPYAQTPTKPYRDLRSFSDHQHVTALISNPTGHVKSVVPQNGVHGDRNNSDPDYAWLDDKLSFISEPTEIYKHGKNGFPQSNWADRYLSEKKDFKKFDQVDDGADSDSSSDLFELPNYDLDCFSSGLPVYETTNMDSIKKTTAIPTATR